MEIIEKLLTPNQYSRPQTKINKIKNVTIHWVGNANTSAIANRNYFESLKDKKIYASSHYIIGLQGEIIRCVPEIEVAYHGNKANSYSIGIECCHHDWIGKFNDDTYNSLIELCSDLCKRYNLDPQKDIIRHYDITGKNCPKWFVNNPKEFDKFKKEVVVAMEDKNKAPEWQIQAIKEVCDKNKLDTELWLSKTTENITVGELFGILNKVVE